MQAVDGQARGIERLADVRRRDPLRVVAVDLDAPDAGGFQERDLVLNIPGLEIEGDDGSERKLWHDL